MSFYEDAKQIIGVIQQSDNIDLLRKFTSFQTDVMGMIEKNHALMEEILALKKENQELNDRISTKNSLVFLSNAYWERKSDGRNIGPYCTGCWGKDEKLVRLHVNEDMKDGYCPVCKVGVTFKAINLDKIYREGLDKGIV